MLFTVETVSCLGACGLAPVVVINDEVHGLMNPEKAVQLVDAICREGRLSDDPRQHLVAASPVDLEPWPASTRAAAGKNHPPRDYLCRHGLHGRRRHEGLRGLRRADRRRPACRWSPSLEAEGGRHPQGLYVSKSGCQGFCQMGPLVTDRARRHPLHQGQAGRRGRDRRDARSRTTSLVERLLYEDPVGGSALPRAGRDSLLQAAAAHGAASRAAGSIRKTSASTSTTAATRRPSRAFRDMTPEAICEEIDPLRPARPRRRRFSHGPEMGAHPPPAGREEIRHLQRRRRRSGRLHGSQRDGGQSAQRDRRHDDRRPGDRRRRGLRLRAGRVSAGRASGSAARFATPRSWACWATMFSAPGTASASR